MRKARGVFVAALLTLYTTAWSTEIKPPVQDLPSGLCPAVAGVTADSPIKASTKSLCTANCGSAGTVSCSGSSTCSAQDQNCSAGIRGQVTCGSTTTQCPPCPVCTEGQVRYMSTSECCCNEGSSTALTLRRVDTCINGSWVVTDWQCDGQLCTTPPALCPV